VVAPIYEWVPLDLFAELLPIPLKDRRDLYYRLSPVTAGPEDSGPLVERALEAKGQLQSPTHPPATRSSETRPK